MAVRWQHFSRLPLIYYYALVLCVSKSVKMDASIHSLAANKIRLVLGLALHGLYRAGPFDTAGNAWYAVSVEDEKRLGGARRKTLLPSAIFSCLSRACLGKS